MFMRMTEQLVRDVGERTSLEEVLGPRGVSPAMDLRLPAPDRTAGHSKGQLIESNYFNPTRFPHRSKLRDR